MLVSTMFAQRDADVRRGYRLHITNLEDRAFTYNVRYWVTPRTSEPRWAAVLNQFFTLYRDAPYKNAPYWDAPAFQRTGSIYVTATSVVVEAKHTVSVGIAPAEISPPIEGIHLLEGYVTLEVPVVRNGQGDSPFRAVPQADRPVKVLLNPETTINHNKNTSAGGYTRNLDGVTTGRVGVQFRLNLDAVESLIPASGKAENEVTPNGILLLSHDALEEVVTGRAAETGSFVGTENLSVADRMGALIELLCELDTKEKFLVELNKVLDRNHAAARICRQKS